MSEPTIKQKYKTYKRKMSDGTSQSFQAVPQGDKEYLYKKDDTNLFFRYGEVERSAEGKARGKFYIDPIYTRAQPLYLMGKEINTPKFRYKAKSMIRKPVPKPEPESSSDEEVSSSEEESAPALPPPPPPIVEPDWGTDIPDEVRLEKYTVRGHDYSVFKYRGDIFVYSDDATEFYGKFVMKNGKVLILDGKPIIDRGTSDPVGV